MWKEGEKGKIISNSNPFRNLDTSSPKVSHDHALKVPIHRQGVLVQSRFGSWTVDSLPPTPTCWKN